MKNSNLLSSGLIALLGSLIITGCGSGGSSSSSSPVGVSYNRFYCPNTVNVSFPGVSGVRQVYGQESLVYVTGVYVQYGSSHAFLYKGSVLGGGNCSEFNFPSAPGRTVTSTSLYGPDNNGYGQVVVVGSYTTLESGPIAQQGLLYIGAADGATLNGYKTLYPTSLTSESIINTLGHSTMGGIVVGNYNTVKEKGKAFIYDINTDTYYSLEPTPGNTGTMTAYGIWYNGGTSYTIAGGYSDATAGGTNIGFITDWDSVSHTVSNFTTLNYNNLPANQVGTHFEGITGDGSGGYNLAADWEYLGQKTSPAFANIKRNSDGSFATPTWVGYNYFPGSSWTSANTVYENYILGLYQAGDPVVDYGYVATINY